MNNKTLAQDVFDREVYLSDEHQYAEMKAYSESNDDEPDGAFFAMAEEMHGWTVDDWAWYAEYKPNKKHENKTKSKTKKGGKKSS
ncbi:MAG: hypothetical protein V4509_01705 [Patescibacteria group bacterium]